MAWKNWAGNQRCNPAVVEHPASEDELAAAIKRAAAADRRVKAIGAGHSFTATALTDGTQLVLDKYDHILHVDSPTRRVTVQAGMSIAALNEALARQGLAMPNLGDIAYQSIAGAVSTATHGTGRNLTGIAGQIVGMTLITGDGSIVRCSADEEPEIFHAARVGVGALGMISTVTLQCVPAFRLHAVEEPMRVDHVLENVDSYVDGNDHFEFFWVPHTGWALTKRNNRTDEPVGGMSRWKFFYEKILLENVAFGAVNRIGRMRPSLIPRLQKLVPSSGTTEYVKPSHTVFASPRFVRFLEMEYSIPRAAVPEALNRVRKLIDDNGWTISFPVEVRFTAPDDIPLSTASGRESGYIAVHVYKGMPHEPYFRGVEAIMNDYGGRPHWGKLHFQTAASLAPRYPEWDKFQSVRKRLDPEGRFDNDYTRTVLGSL